jgi:hypothetical protein
VLAMQGAVQAPQVALTRQYVGGHTGAVQGATEAGAGRVAQAPGPTTAAPVPSTAMRTQTTVRVWKPGLVAPQDALHTDHGVVWARGVSMWVSGRVVFVQRELAGAAQNNPH